LARLTAPPSYQTGISMNISMHHASVGVYARLLTNLAGILDKTEKWIAERRIEPGAILHARLAPDMFDFTRQVQIATDMAKGTCARLAGQEVPRFEDNETSLAQLKARVEKTVAFLQSLPPAAFEGAEDRAITLRVGPPGGQRELNFVGLDYLLGFGTPNVYFHYSMVYALLRHNGLDLGKPDYVGK
jgi:hypothetical protein